MHLFTLLVESLDTNATDGLTIMSGLVVTQQQFAGVILPNNLVCQTIAYLESRNDPMALMLRQHYKHWLEMSEQGKRVRNRQHESLKPKLETLTPVDAIYAQEPE